MSNHSIEMPNISVKYNPSMVLNSVNFSKPRESIGEGATFNDSQTLGAHPHMASITGSHVKDRKMR